MDKEVAERFDATDSKIDKLTFEVGRLCGTDNTRNLMVKWVVFPLIVILAGLAGVTLW